MLSLAVGFRCDVSVCRLGVLLLAVSSRTSLLIPQLVSLCSDRGLRLVEPILDAAGEPTSAATHGGWVFRFER